MTNPQELRLLIREFGILGPFALVALQALQVVVAPVPGQVLAVVAGYLYGAWWGTFYNMLGITLGSTAAFWLSRRYGRPYVEQISHAETLMKFDDIDDNHQRLALFVMFLVPGLPDDAICFVGGLTRLPLWQLVVLAVVGRAPGFFLVNVIGEYVEAGRFDAAILLAVGLAVVTAIGYRYRERLFEAFTLR
ncbi:TVP38/TMEM64 family protein [Haloarcula sp. S1AR25-5A]|uniref:TVP38/TMEM64 family protein n=1 Tax=Haloarcula terrestris TaxID=2950533 RepID=A0AAE4F1Z1_9EURY|nr:TVP38/TMEM64 family protein [Haloarcula terrestris]MDS0223367.1 TVP38/TMEM64 family protein [Haloarcula terrestris]